MIDSVNTEAVLDASQFTVRQVTQADLPALEWEGEFIKYRRMYANIYRSTLTGRALMWLIETSAGKLIGQAFVMLKSGEQDAADGKNRAYLFAFRIKPPWRRQGIGTYLMHFIEDDLQSRGFRYLTLNVAKDNQNAIRLYRRLGYKVIGPRSGDWSFIDHEGKVQDVHEPAWRMMKRISKD